MKSTIRALGALAQESRLSIFRLLVVAGPAGLPVGKIAEQLGLANATLSFHLKELTNAGLTTPTPNGRSISYSANFEQMTELISFLTENCCAGGPCAPAIQSRSVCPPRPVSPPKPSPPSSTSNRRKS